MKSLFVAASILLATTAANAKSLVLVLNDSTKVYFLLSEMPEMTVDEGTLTVKDKSFVFSEVDRFYISETDDPNGIEQLLAKRHIAYDGTTIVVASEGEAAIYTVDGKKVQTTAKKSDGYTTLYIATLPVGAYLLRVGNESFKFMKK